MMKLIVLFFLIIYFNNNLILSFQTRKVYYNNKHAVTFGAKPTKLSGELKSSQLSSVTIPLQVPRLPYGLIWLGLLTYAFTIAPGGLVESTAVDNAIIAKMISTPFDGSTNPIFVFLFNALGILPAVYASLLLPGSKFQKVPALPFVVSSFALGFFGIGPYLAARNINTDVTSATKGRGSSLFEFKATSLSLLAFGLFLLNYLVNQFDSKSVTDFIQLFLTQKLVHVSTIDFTILSLAVWEPIREDIIRRLNSEENTNVNFKAALFSLIPIFGPVIYLITRPSLKNVE